MMENDHFRALTHLNSINPAIWLRLLPWNFQTELSWVDNAVDSPMDDPVESPLDRVMRGTATEACTDIDWERYEYDPEVEKEMISAVLSSSGTAANWACKGCNS